MQAEKALLLGVELLQEPQKLVHIPSLHF